MPKNITHSYIKALKFFHKNISKITNRAPEYTDRGKTDRETDTLRLIQKAILIGA